MGGGPGDVGWASMRHARGSAEDVPALLEAMRSADGDARLDARRAFRGRVFRRGDIYRCTTASLPFLFAMATDAETPDRDEVVRLLSEIGQRAVDRLNDDPFDGGPVDDDAEPGRESDHVAAARTVTERGDVFLELAVDADPAVRRAAIPGLASFVGDAERAAVLIRDRLPVEPGTVERLLLVETMATLAARRPQVGTDARAWLDGLAADPALDPETRMAAVIHTARSAPERIDDDLVPAVVGLLKTARNGSPAVLRTLHRVLGTRNPQRTTLLAAQLRSTDPDVVLDATTTAVELITHWRGDHSGLVTDLAGLLRSPDPRVAAEAAFALRICHAVAEPAREALAAVVAARGPTGWTDADAAVRRAHQEAVGALALLGDLRAVPSLLVAFDEPFEDWRAVGGVGALAGAATDLVPRLCGVLHRQKPLSTANEVTAEYALDALATLAPGRSDAMVAEVLDAVADLLRATSRRYLPSLTVAALTTFGAFGPAAAAMLPTIRELAGSTHPFVRPAAVGALWAVGRDLDEVMPVLTRLLDDDAPVAVRLAADTLALVGPPAAAALPHLRARLADGYESVRVPCATAIWDIAGEREAATVLDVLLAEWAERPAVAYPVIACLDRMGPAAAPAVPLVRDELARAARNGNRRDIGRDEDLQRMGRAVLARVRPPMTRRER